MDVLDLYETGEWSAASSPCSELFEDVDISSSTSDLEDSYINDFSIDFASYLDPAALSTSPEDLNKYLPPKESKSVKKTVEPYLPEVDGYIPKKSSVVVKVEPKVDSQKPAVSYRNKSPTMVPRETVPQSKQASKLPSIASQLKAPSSRTSRRHSISKRNSMDKHSEEYRQKRERNNVAVRKSRFKSKQKFIETQSRVEELTEENERLHSRIDIITKELNALRSLFSNPSVFKDLALARALLAQGLAQ
ncbi:uncharacterized protein LOC116618583 [Nematostella vectensis]|nr:uncharacterized protein LOC116618583 [Nematostella vectensis]